MGMSDLLAVGGRVVDGRVRVPRPRIQWARTNRERIESALRAAESDLRRDETFGVPSEGDALLLLVWDVFREAS